MAVKFMQFEEEMYDGYMVPITPYVEAKDKSRDDDEDKD